LLGAEEVGLPPDLERRWEGLVSGHLAIQLDRGAKEGELPQVVGHGLASWASPPRTGRYRGWEALTGPSADAETGRLPVRRAEGGLDPLHVSPGGPFPQHG